MTQQAPSGWHHEWFRDDVDWPTLPGTARRGVQLGLRSFHLFRYQQQFVTRVVQQVEVQ